MTASVRPDPRPGNAHDRVSAAPESPPTSQDGVVATANDASRVSAPPIVEQRLRAAHAGSRVSARARAAGRSPDGSRYARYGIPAAPAPDVAPWPSRFKVQVRRLGLAKLLIKELVAYRGNLSVVLSRPCMYGVFSGPLGGFAPREKLCVGCLRCTTQYPDFVTILRNPERADLGDSYFTPDQVEAVIAEAQTGAVPVRGAGYRGRFGGEGWDGMWTDMSEIVRPTRDGIHGREFISTVVDLGGAPPFLHFDAEGQLRAFPPPVRSIPLPILFDVPPGAALDDRLAEGLLRAAEAVGTYACLPAAQAWRGGAWGRNALPIVASRADLDLVGPEAEIVELAGWDPRLAEAVRARGADEGVSGRASRHPAVILAARIPLGSGANLAAVARAGCAILHLTCDYHGRGADGRFVLDLLREAHQSLVDSGLRDTVTVVASGGIVAAEHVPKAILCGADAVAIDTAALAALQGRFAGDVRRARAAQIEIPATAGADWIGRRLVNVCSSWRDQLLEIMGAMGIREVRRLRGEMGRAMFQRDLERDAFGAIQGYPRS